MLQIRGRLDLCEEALDGVAPFEGFVEAVDTIMGRHSGNMGFGSLGREARFPDCPQERRPGPETLVESSELRRRAGLPANSST